jgi:hypothetical protein
MWCSSCQQEVPAVAHGAKGRIACARCQQELVSSGPTPEMHICDDGISLDDPAAAAAAQKPPLAIDEWHIARQVRHLGRELRRPNINLKMAAAPFPAGPRGFDPPRELFGGLPIGTLPAPEPMPAQLPPAPSTIQRPTEGSQLFAWLIVVCGTISTAAGVGGIAWSLANHQMQYWNAALGLTLGGQGLLIFGLVLVVARLWRNSRFASGKLQDVHARLGQLQVTAEALAATRGGAPAFYADLARGASPHILLANLKGQLDQLATRLINC